MAIASAKARRLRRHVIKKVRTTIHGLRPSAIQGRFTARKVMLNSIPKAGTHLLENALEQFPLMRNAGKQTASCWLDVPPRVEAAIRSISRGEFLNAHVPAVELLKNIVQEQGIRVLFVIRDPRDIVVSYFKYVSEIDKTHFLYEHFNKISNDEDRLMATIQGIKNVKPSVGEELRAFQGWMDLDAVLVCRFEELIGAQGGGSAEQQGELLERISEHLEISMSKAEIERVAAKTFSSRSSTFRKGRSGAWRSHFSEQHIAAMKADAGQELIRFGYEPNMDWS